jgi:hypothetical protein
MVQKGISMDIDVNIVMLASYIQFMDGAHWIFCLAGQRPEGRKIMLTDQVRGRLPHTVFVEQPMLPCDFGTQHGGAYPTI